MSISEAIEAKIDSHFFVFCDSENQMFPEIVKFDADLTQQISL